MSTLAQVMEQQDKMDQEIEEMFRELQYDDREDRLMEDEELFKWSDDA